MSILMLIIAPIILVLALAVRFAGPAKILNVVDYSQVRDPASLHAWAGNRLLVLAFVTGGLAAASIFAPRFSIALTVAAVLLIAGVAIWLAAGSVKFQARR